MRLRPPVSSSFLLFFVSAFLLSTGNVTFFQQTAAVYSIADNLPFLISLTIVLLCAILFFGTVFSFFLPVRFVASVFLIAGSVVSYFTDNLGIVIDTEMIRNIVMTDPREVADLMNWGLFMQVTLFGVVPTILVYFVSIKAVSFVKRQVKLVGTAVVSILIIAASVVPFSDSYASYVREHKPLRYFTNPTYPIYSVIKLAIDSNTVIIDHTYNQRVDSAITPPEDDEHELVIVIVGETARADHFGLNGYERQTTPKLANHHNLLSFRNMKSCGTSTARSLPCMFSLDGRDDFVIETADFTENVIDVLAKAGVSVLWRDNNSGAQGVAGRIDYESFKRPDQNTVCDEEECRDIGMLAGLDDFIAQQAGDILIVLHQIGSHGPAYFKRYPSDFSVFTPDCHSQELSTCSDEEIINAYDNTILYTDSFLSAVIDYLKTKQDQYETTMMYLSDHGESLGELGIYLHGMPYAIAPTAQTHVPFMVWASDSSDIDKVRLKWLIDKQLTHDDFSRILLETFEIIIDGNRVSHDLSLLPMTQEDYDR